MTWIITVDDLLDANLEGIHKELSYVPKDSLTDCFHAVVKMLSFSDLVYSRLEVLLQAFLNAGMMINSMDVNGNTPFINAMRSGCAKETVCRLLLNFGANVNTCGSNTSYTAISVAFQQRDWHMTRFLHKQGAKLGGAKQKWDSDIFRRVIADDNLRILNVLLDQFDRNKKQLPWKEIVTMCGIYQREKCAMQIVRHQSFKNIASDGSFCPHLWCLDFVERVHFLRLMYLLFCQNPRIYQSGLAVSDTVQKMHEYEDSRYFLKKLLRRLNVLDNLGPQFEVVVYKTVHKNPPPLRMLCRSAILTHLGENARKKIPDLPVPSLIKSYLCESTNKTVLNVDEETREKAMRLRHKIPKKAFRLLFHNTRKMEKNLSFTIWILTNT